MYTADPIWLKPEDIVKKFKDFCDYNNITPRMLIKLFDSFLLRGRDNRKTKDIEILVESFEDLKKHIEYNFDKRISKEASKLGRPHYLTRKYTVFYDSSNNWYTPKEVLHTYSPFLKYEKSFSCEFIGSLALIGLIIGKFNTSENCYHVQLSSFLELMKYQEYSLQQYRIFPTDEAQA